MQGNLAELFEILSQKMEEHESKVIEMSSFRNLSMKQIHYLDVISHMENPTLGELAIRLELSKPSITAIIDRFESDGFIVKNQNDNDRRIQHIELSEKGKQISNLHDEIHRGFAEYFKQNLDNAEIYQLTAIISKVIEKLP